jgi:ATP-dependent Clp protease ATP-binding subunit ClpB
MSALLNNISHTFSIAQAIAKENHHGNYGAAHLLLALMHNELGLAAELVSHGIDINYVKEWAEMRIDQYPKSTVLSSNPLGDAGVNKVIELADMERLKLNQDDISNEALLAALCKPDIAFSKDQLKSFTLKEEDILRIFFNERNALHTLPNSSQSNGQVSNMPINTSALSKYCINKSLLAKEGKLEAIMGRDKEIRQALEILGRHTKPNPLVIGEPGVGKSTLVDGLAILSIQENAPASIRNIDIYELDSGSLIAGASYKGEVEDRMKKIIEAIKGNNKKILFIDEIHQLMDNNGGFGGVANLLKPELARGELSLVGATTHKEYREHIEHDPAFSRRFAIVEVDEPDVETTVAMITNAKDKYCNHHKMELQPESIKEAVILAKRYLSERKLPDVAIDLIDNTMSAINIARETTPEQLEIYKLLIEDAKNGDQLTNCINNLRKSVSPVIIGKLSQHQNEFESFEAIKNYCIELLSELDNHHKNLQMMVTPADIAALVAVKTNIPLGKLQASEKEKLLCIEDILKQRVIGQEQAIETVSKAILESRAGLKKANKPIGSFFFVGPTGTGKTELAKTLTEYLFDDETALIRFDMSEFKESVSAALLYGASPGYVGYKEGGLLVNKIRQKPFSIVLFDEIEKAHESVFDVFLQILDEGRLTDKQGKVGDFSNAIILFTSNLGQSYIVDYFEKNGKLPNSEWIKENYLNDPNVKFRPEFLGRMDAIVPFAPISEQAVVQIFDIQLKELKNQLKRQNIGFEITDEAKKEIAFNGFNPKFGARPIREIIKTKLRQPLSYMIIKGELHEGDVLQASIDDGSLALKVKKSN